MSRRTFYYDKDLDAIVERRGNYFEERPQGPSVISDDVGAGVNGLRHMPSGQMLDSKSAHRKENRRRGLEEVGNQTNVAGKKASHTAHEYGEMVHEARQQIEGDYNGTRGWLERQKERSNG